MQKVIVLLIAYAAMAAHLVPEAGCQSGYPLMLGPQSNLADGSTTVTAFEGIQRVNQTDWTFMRSEKLWFLGGQSTSNNYLESNNCQTNGCAFVVVWHEFHDILHSYLLSGYETVDSMKIHYESGQSTAQVFIAISRNQKISFLLMSINVVTLQDLQFSDYTYHPIQRPERSDLLNLPQRADFWVLLRDKVHLTINRDQTTASDRFEDYLLSVDWSNLAIDSYKVIKNEISGGEIRVWNQIPGDNIDNDFIQAFQMTYDSGAGDEFYAGLRSCEFRQDNPLYQRQCFLFVQNQGTNPDQFSYKSLRRIDESVTGSAKANLIAVGTYSQSRSLITISEWKIINYKNIDHIKSTTLDFPFPVVLGSHCFNANSNQDKFTSLFYQEEGNPKITYFISGSETLRTIDKHIKIPLPLAEAGFQQYDGGYLIHLAGSMSSPNLGPQPFFLQRNNPSLTSSYTWAGYSYGVFAEFGNDSENGCFLYDQEIAANPSITNPSITWTSMQLNDDQLWEDGTLVTVDTGVYFNEMLQTPLSPQSISRSNWMDIYNCVRPYPFLDADFDPTPHWHIVGKGQQKVKVSFPEEQILYDNCPVSDTFSMLDLKIMSFEPYYYPGLGYTSLTTQNEYVLVDVDDLSLAGTALYVNSKIEELNYYASVPRTVTPWFYVLLVDIDFTSYLNEPPNNSTAYFGATVDPQELKVLMDVEFQTIINTPEVYNPGNGLMETTPDFACVNKMARLVVGNDIQHLPSFLTLVQEGQFAYFKYEFSHDMNQTLTGTYQLQIGCEFDYEPMPGNKYTIWHPDTWTFDLVWREPNNTVNMGCALDVIDQKEQIQDQVYKLEYPYPDLKIDPQFSNSMDDCYLMYRLNTNAPLDLVYFDPYTDRIMIQTDDPKYRDSSFYVEIQAYLEDAEGIRYKQAVNRFTLTFDFDCTSSGNQAPRFKGDFPNLVKVVAGVEREVLMPAISDHENDAVEMKTKIVDLTEEKVLKDEQLMIMTPTSLKIKVPETSNSTYFVEISLEDGLSCGNTYSMIIEVVSGFGSNNTFEAQIVSISQSGLVIINFDVPVNDYNLTFWNNTNLFDDSRPLELNLIHIDYEELGERPPVLKSWNVTNQTNQQMLIQLKFEDPLLVSQTPDWDRLNITFRWPSEIKAQNSNFGELGTKHLIFKLPPQFRSPKDQELAQRIADLMQQFSMPFYGLLVLRLLRSVSMRVMWSMMSALQILYLQPHFRLKFPGNAQSVHDIFKQITEFELIPKNQIIDWFFPWQADQQSSIDDPLRGQEPASLLKRGGFYMFMLIGLIALTVLVFGLGFLLQKIKCCKDLIDNLKKRLLFNPFLRAYLQGYLKISVTATAQLLMLDFASSWSSVFESSLAIVLALISLVLPVVFTILLSKNQEQLGTESLKQKMGALYVNISLEERVLSVGTKFVLIYCLRRFIVAIIISFVADWRLQMLIIQASSISLVSFLGYYLILATPFENRLEIYNEMLIFTSNYTLLWFTDYIVDVNLRYQVGWTYVGLVCFLMVTNTALQMWMLLRFLYRWGYKKYLKCKKPGDDGGSPPPPDNKVAAKYKPRRDPSPRRIIPVPVLQQRSLLIEEMIENISQKIVEEDNESDSIYYQEKQPRDIAIDLEKIQESSLSEIEEVKELPSVLPTTQINTDNSPRAQPQLLSHDRSPLSNFYARKSDHVLLHGQALNLDFKKPVPRFTAKDNSPIQSFQEATQEPRLSMPNHFHLDNFNMPQVDDLDESEEEVLDLPRLSNPRVRQPRHTVSTAVTKPRLTGESMPSQFGQHLRILSPIKSSPDDSPNESRQLSPNPSSMSPRNSQQLSPAPQLKLPRDSKTSAAALSPNLLQLPRNSNPTHANQFSFNQLQIPRQSYDVGKIRWGSSQQKQRPKDNAPNAGLQKQPKSVKGVGSPRRSNATDVPNRFQPRLSNVASAQSQRRSNVTEMAVRPPGRESPRQGNLAVTEKLSLPVASQRVSSPRKSNMTLPDQLKLPQSSQGVEAPRRSAATDIVNRLSSVSPKKSQFAVADQLDQPRKSHAPPNPSNLFERPVPRKSNAALANRVPSARKTTVPQFLGDSLNLSPQKNNLERPKARKSAYESRSPMPSARKDRSVKQIKNLNKFI